MLAVQIKPDEEILPLISSKRIFVFECLGCRDVHYPVQRAGEFIDGLKQQVLGKATLDYLCHREFVQEYIRAYADQLEKAEVVLVLSCGVGVQVVCSLLEDRTVYTGCDTLHLNGFQGLTAKEYDCEQCGECYLNYTGGMCPVALCSKHLLNGPCGGSQQGKCEVDPDMPCVWQQIVDRLIKLGRGDVLERLGAPKNWNVSPAP
ncbi:MAG: methylenetetrahydrofolate reductase C-terminal domain-containing protein [Dehalococcoidia bacterium]|nr:methylenetetrahydrofolate reductase C-terminal domain-containing protein [Dehalococcoidia bacterium]